MTIQQQYEAICTKYVQAFLIKHEFHENGILFDWEWQDRPGCTVFVSDYYLDFDDIRTDIDEEAPEDMFFEWCDYSLNKTIDNVPYANYKNYLKGAR